MAALDRKTFKTRAVTSIVFVLIMLLGLLWNQWSFIVLFTIIHFGCWYELVKLMKKIYGENYLVRCLFGLLYITMPVAMVIHLRLLPSNALFDFRPLIPFFLVLCIWINDTMAYIVGSFIGKTPFSKISPKKTWEGTIGGAVCCIVIMALVGFYATIDSICIAAIAAVFGTAGDLLESKLKRMAGVKDSGTIMPGHGGFLDRFDSLLVAIPFVWVYVLLFM